jgi:multiple sugar transport system permease protein
MSQAVPITARSVPATRRPRARRVRGVIRYAAIVAVVTFFLLPILWMVSASFQSNIDILDTSRIFDFTPTLANYDTVFNQQQFAPFIVNSFVVGAASTALALLIGVPAAYGIARFRVRNATVFVLLARIIPAICLLVPWYFLFAQFQLVGTYTVLMLTHMFVTMPLVVAIMSSFFEGIPRELEESAQIDGSSRIGAFLRVVLPLSTPGIATATILSFIFSWNNFLFALVLSNQQTRTLPVAISNFTSYAAIDWGGLMAASVIITVPVIAIALICQRYVVSGLAAGATKG